MSANTTTINDDTTIDETIDETPCICDFCHDEVAATYTMMKSGRAVEVCGDCARDYGIGCANCGILHHRDDITNIGVYISVCDDCLRENYMFCSRCARYVHNDDYAAYMEMCADCLTDAATDCDGLLHLYSYTPKLTFFRGAHQPSQNQLYFGVELEYHCSNAACRYNVVMGWDDSGSGAARWYAKEDGSLQSGVEFVSHPHTLQAWVEQYDAVATRMEKALRNGAYCNNDSGLHIHISKAGMADAHKARFGAFVHLNVDRLVHIARRASSDWASFKSKKAATYYLDGKGAQYSRYEAVNWRPAWTVELRFFKSTTNVDEFFAALEFAHAAYQYTKTGAVSMCHICRDVTHGWPLFVEFVRNNRQYPTLCQMLKAGLI